MTAHNATRPPETFRWVLTIDWNSKARGLEDGDGIEACYPVGWYFGSRNAPALLHQGQIAPAHVGDYFTFSILDVTPGFPTETISHVQLVFSSKAKEPTHQAPFDADLKSVHTHSENIRLDPMVGRRGKLFLVFQDRQNLFQLVRSGNYAFQARFTARDKSGRERRFHLPDPEMLICPFEGCDDEPLFPDQGRRQPDREPAAGA